jgi:hypothetical protein
MTVPLNNFQRLVNIMDMRCFNSHAGVKYLYMTFINTVISIRKFEISISNHIFRDKLQFLLFYTLEPLVGTLVSQFPST